MYTPILQALATVPVTVTEPGTGSGIVPVPDCTGGSGTGSGSDRVLVLKKAILISIKKSIIVLYNIIMAVYMQFS